MTIQHEILSFNPLTASILVKYYSTDCSEELIFNIDLPIEDGKFPEPEQIEEIIKFNAPKAQLERLNAVKTVQVPTFLSEKIPSPVTETEPVIVNSTNGDEVYTPTVGQFGKNGTWYPTPEANADEVFALLNLTTADVFYDLGSGDGQMAIKAAKEFGCRAVGIEFNKDLCDLAGRNAARAGVADRVSFINADFFTADISEATALYMFQDLEVANQFAARFSTMRAGVKIAGYGFKLFNFIPAATAPSNAVFMWQIG
jgi:hypothetical protein